jgi:hypothetical protein
MALNFFGKARRALLLTPSDRLIHAESNLMLYEFVARRLDSGVFDLGVWAMAMEKSHGDEDRAKGIYIGLSVKRLKREIAAGVGIAKEFKKFEGAMAQEVALQRELQKEIDKLEDQRQKLEIKIEKSSEGSRIWGALTIIGFASLPFSELALFVGAPAGMIWLSRKMNSMGVKSAYSKSSRNLEMKRDELQNIQGDRLITPQAVHEIESGLSRY